MRQDRRQLLRHERLDVELEGVREAVAELRERALEVVALVEEELDRKSVV